jgi:hypothetical protein
MIKDVIVLFLYSKLENYVFIKSKEEDVKMIWQ